MTLPPPAARAEPEAKQAPKRQCPVRLVNRVGMGYSSPISGLWRGCAPPTPPCLRFGMRLSFPSRGTPTLTLSHLPANSRNGRGPLGDRHGQLEGRQNAWYRRVGDPTDRARERLIPPIDMTS